jgi:3-dehydroquinate synthase
MPAGERSKSLESYAQVVRELAREGLTRDGTLFALGGGVVGDLAGFVAATYMRGIRLVALPTSLLAMVDSSVGGKTGLDLPEGKNMIGAFLQPAVVVADLAWLETLPPRELCCGLAEVVKMGLLSGGGFFGDLARLDEARAKDPEALRALVSHSVRFKAGVVAADERERGRRAILNYGHTVGHGLEAASGYALLHGEAVAAGMVAEAALSSKRFGRDLLGLHRELVAAAGLPERVGGVRAEEAMRRDKKRRGDGHRFVLLRDVGDPVWGVPVGETEARRAVEVAVG